MATYGGEKIHMWSFMDLNNWADFDTFEKNGSRFHLFSQHQTTPAQFDAVQWTINPNPGTFKLYKYTNLRTDSGVVHYSHEGGPDLTTIDLNSGGGFVDKHEEVRTGIPLSVPGTFQAAMDTSTTGGYRGDFIVEILERTGA